MKLEDFGVRHTYLIGFLIVMLPAATNAANLFSAEFENAVFHCSLLDGATVSGDGTLERDAGVEWFQEHYAQFTFNASTGELLSGAEASAWTITRAGDMAHDLVAQLPGGDPLYNVLRISTWTSPMRVSMTDGMDLYAGTCVRSD